ncbi:MAG: S41 family peptidase, partial [Planctomycetota bacterium]
GIGVEIKPDDAGVIVVRTLAGGPARNGGLERGDVITAIDGKTLAGRGLDYAVELISGPIGSSLRVTAAKADGRRGTVTLTRNRVELKSVSEAKILDKASGVAYLKLDSFATTSEEEIDEALWSLWNQGMKSLVFDVRGNPGGLLTGAIGISNRFLPDGTIVSTKGRTREDNTSESAVRGRTWKIPMVVLVDGGSASASEIFAAAIQENGRGLVVGETSYGKGTVQTHFPLQSVAGNLKITTAKFYSPNGREMAGAGVTPDVHVAGTDEIVPLSQDRVVVEAVRLAAGRDAYELARATQQRLSGLTAAR